MSSLPARTAFLSTLTPTVVRYLSSKRLLTNRRTRLVLPTPPAPRSAIFFCSTDKISSRAAIIERRERDARRCGSLPACPPRGSHTREAMTDYSATATRDVSPDGKPAEDAGGAASLDKVRDILFGAQVRETDRRFAQLEELIKQEFASLAERLEHELKARGDADHELSREVRELRQQLLEAQQRIRDEIQQHAQEHATRLARESALLRN